MITLLQKPRSAALEALRAKVAVKEAGRTSTTPLVEVEQGVLKQTGRLREIGGALKDLEQEKAQLEAVVKPVLETVRLGLVQQVRANVKSIKLSDGTVYACRFQYGFAGHTVRPECVEALAGQGVAGKALADALSPVLGLRVKAAKPTATDDGRPSAFKNPGELVAWLAEHEPETVARLEAAGLRLETVGYEIEEAVHEAISVDPDLYDAAREAGIKPATVISWPGVK